MVNNLNVKIQDNVVDNRAIQSREIKYKYDIGHQYFQYEIIGRRYTYRKHGNSYHLEKLYMQKCLQCGAVKEVREEHIDKKVKCRECMRKMEYSKYNVGDIVNGLEILEKKPQFRAKYKNYIPAYLCRCVKDGYESIHLESNLDKGKGCCVCAGTVILKGVNDINTIAPWIGDFLLNKEDAYKYGVGSKQKLPCKCPKCGTITKPLCVYNLYIGQNFKCPKCGDGVSMPEKILYSMLDSIGIEFEYQKTFAWIESRFYDFYIPSKNMIIETHGLQHYNKTTHSKWDSLQEIQENDKFKKDCAMNNGIEKYIEIDCSNMSPLIIMSKCLEALSIYFDFSNIDKNEIIRIASNSFCIRTGDMWNQGFDSVDLIANKLKLNDSTIRKYLKILNSINYLSTPYPIQKNKKNKT